MAASGGERTWVVRWSMEAESTPWLSAHDLRLQVDGVLKPVVARANRDPDHELGGKLLSTLFRVLFQIRDRYGKQLLVEEEIWEWLFVREPEFRPVADGASPPEPITAEAMWALLESVRASLVTLETLEAQRGASAAAAAAPARPVVTQPVEEPPPGQPGSAGPDGRRFRISVGRQRFHSTDHSARDLPW